MPRDANGDYTKPLPDVVAGDVIQSGWANTTIADLEQAMTDSLDRNGRGGMLAPFLNADGVVNAPGITFANEPTSGIYRAAAGDFRMSVLGQDLTRWNSGNFQVWNSTDAVWETVLVSSATSAPVVPGTESTSTIHWNGRNPTLVARKMPKTVRQGVVSTLDGTVDFARVVAPKMIR